MLEIKNSEGGYKLSFEMIKILAIAFEDVYLPGDAINVEALANFLKTWDPDA